MKDKIKRWYRQGLWTAEMVGKAVTKGILSPKEVEEILIKL